VFKFRLELFLCYDIFGDNMKHCEFEKEEKYKLYRSVKEILHPTISKKNISDYKIIIRDDLLPVRTFYPRKVSHLDQVILYIHGECKITNCKGKYSEISTNLAQEVNQLILSIDYDELNDFSTLYQRVYETFHFIYQELIDVLEDPSKITIMADSTGTTILFSILEKMKQEKFGKMILFYPVLSGEYYGKTQYNSLENNSFDHDLVKKLKNYYKKKNEGNKEVFPYLNKNSYPKGLVIVGGVDPLLDEAKDFVQNNQNCELKIVTFANHGFLGSKDEEIKKEYYTFIHNFFDENN